MKIGIVGCGTAVKYHIPGLQRINKTEIIGVCDVIGEKAKTVANEYGIKNSYTDLTKMVEEQKPDVIHVLTPWDTHADVSIKAMELGCHVLVEKPMALKLRDADRMISAAESNNIKLCINHNYLFYPIVRKALSLIKNGAIGNIVHTEVRYFLSRKQVMQDKLYDPPSNHWIRKLPAGLGVIEELSPHMIYFLLISLRNVRSVDVIIKKDGNQAVHPMIGWNIMLDADNATGYLSMIQGTDYGEQSIHIYGTKMALHINLNDLTMIKQKERNLPRIPARMLTTVEQNLQGLYGISSNILKIFTGRLKRKYFVSQNLFEEFYESITNNGEPPISGVQGREVVRILEMIYEQINKKYVD